ncbi:Hsp20/alpha crystallin family protein [Candidatus Parcubacteria bacterium]|nr:Hsp20/alpha crystallin family protein [Candidatus Parcubacteria bacterium]
MSFLKKLKQNIGVEESEKQSEEKPNKKKIKTKKSSKIKVIESNIVEDKKTNEKLSLAKASASKEKWFEQKGELTVDVFQTKDDLVIQSAIAGVKPENLDIIIENDILTIEGTREKPLEDENEEKNYFYQECYWGPFYKRIILQEEVDNSHVEAVMKQGILTIRIPKIQRKKKRKINIKT